MKEEINLTTLFVLIARSIRKHFILLIVLLALGGVGGFIASLLLPQKYVSRAVFYSSTLDIQEVKSQLEHLNKTLKFGDRTTLTPQGNEPWGSVYEVALVQKLSSAPVVEKERNPLEQINTSVWIYVEAGKPTVFDTLDRVLESYFQASRSVQERFQDRKQVLEKLVVKLERAIEQQQQLSANALEGSISNLTLQHLQANEVSIYGELAQAELQLNQLQAFQTVEPFYIPKEPDTKKTLFVLAGALITLVAGLLIRFVLRA